MWTNSQLKENAKKSLSNHYFIALIATIIVMALTGQMGTGSSSGYSGTTDFSEIFDTSDYSDDYDYDDDYDDDYDYSDEEFDAFMEDFYNEYGQNDDSYHESDEYYDDFYDYDYYEDYSSDYFEEYFSEIFGEFSNEINNVDDLMEIIAGGIAVFAVIILISTLVGLAYSIFFANPLEAGHCRFYLDARMGGANIGRIFSQFSSGLYMATVKTMFVMKLKLWLWGLIASVPIFFAIGGTVKAITEADTITSSGITDFILSLLAIWVVAALASAVLSIPQIIKKYQYFLVPYLTAENPSLGTKRIFELSKKLMKGEKLHVFGLQLSFIGWLILSGMAAGIVVMIPLLGILLMFAVQAAVYPYINATNAEFYCCMREKAMSTGISDSFELNGIFGSFNAAYPQGQYSEPYQPYKSDSINSSGSFGESNQNGYNPVNSGEVYSQPYQPYSSTDNTGTSSSGNEFVSPDSTSTDSDNSDDGYNGPEIM